MVSGQKTTTTEVQLFESERDALVKAVAARGYDAQAKASFGEKAGLSTFLRKCAFAAAYDYVQDGKDPADGVADAAAAAGCTAGEWIRIVALSAIKWSDLQSQIEHAVEAFESGALDAPPIEDEPEKPKRRARRA